MKALSAGPQTLLINMPFSTASMPSIGLGVLQARLRSEGNHCDVANLNLDFAASLGPGEYNLLAQGLPPTTLAGEWVFAKHLFPSHHTDTNLYYRFVSEASPRLADEAVKALTLARELVPTFLDKALREIRPRQYDIFGFTSMFHQTVPSLCLARLIKELHPDATVVFGGANMEGPMGQAIAEGFRFVDYVCDGEGDLSLPLLVTAIKRSERPGVVGNIFRRSQEGATGPGDADGSVEKADMDALPIPSYDEFQDAASRLLPGMTVTTPIEFSRGCWWGAKHHCTFCGLNGGSMTYRSKQPDRALRELHALAAAYGPRFMVVDNIFDMSYLRSLFPRLSQSQSGYSLFIESKANLKREEIALLAASGVTRLQPGIESLSSSVLALMRKGTTKLQNLQTLKWCKRYRVSVAWNLLTGFPGERDADYDDTLRLLPLLYHLDPPMGVGPIRIDRFSPLFEGTVEGVAERTAHAAYSWVFPFTSASLDRLAYYFEAEFSGPVASRRCNELLSGAVGEWRQRAESSTLTLGAKRNGEVRVRDGRDGSEEELCFTGLQARILMLTDRIRSTNQIAKAAGARTDGVRLELARLHELGLVTAEGERWLGLAIPEGESRRSEVSVS